MKEQTSRLKTENKSNTRSRSALEPDVAVRARTTGDFIFSLN